MGACCDPPNLAIVMALASNGSLWDALRKPLPSPYQAVGSGTTKKSWPSRLYPTETVPDIPSDTWQWELVWHVASGAARGMAYLHSGSPPVLHRDLKSPNLLLDESFTVKICDFGLSRIKSRNGMTGNLGTVQWMAPEVLANKSYAEPVDVYSFGIILWELLSGECPHKGMGSVECAQAVYFKKLRPEIPSWCPPRLSTLIESCWHHEPSRRPTFQAILKIFDDLQESS